jgi:hypothetical protein
MSKEQMLKELQGAWDCGFKASEDNFKKKGLATKPLNISQINLLFDGVQEKAIATGKSINEIFARRIELAHGIGEENEHHRPN